MAGPQTPPDVQDYRLGWNPLSFVSSTASAAAKAAAARAALAKKKPVASGLPPTTGPWAYMTDAQIQAEADKRLEAAYAGQTDPIKRAAAEAAARALGAQQAEIGFTTAGQAQLGNVGPKLAGAYADTNVTAGTSPEAQAFAGQDNTAIQGTGHAAQSWGEQLAGIQGNLGQETLGSLIAAGEQQQKDYEQQLIDLAHQKPELRGQILDQLYQNEVAKAQLASTKAGLGLDQQKYAQSEADRLTQSTGYLYVVGPDGKPHKATDKNGKFIPTVQGKAETANEAALGLDTQKFTWQQQMDAAQLQLKAGQYKQQNAIALQKLVQQGAQIDAAASKVAKHIVLKDGSVPTGPNGKPIPVAAAAPASGTSFQKAVKEAKSLRGKPALYQGSKVIKIAATKDVYNADGSITPGHPASITKIKGKYIASSTAKGVYSVPDPTRPGQFIRTTNDPRKAQAPSQYTFTQAVDYLVSAYKLTPAQAAKALRAAGWIP